MPAFMKKYCDFMDRQELIVKILFAIPVLDIMWNLYRFFKSYEKNNVLGMVISAAVTLFFSWNVIAIFDIVMLAVQGKIWWMD